MLVVDISPEDVVYGERGGCNTCPVARALSRMMPASRWTFDGVFAVNPHYGTFGLLQRVGWDGGAAAIMAYDGGAPLSVRRLVMVRCDS